MSEFINTIEQLGDDVVLDSSIDGVIMIKVDGSEHYNSSAQIAAKVRSLLETTRKNLWRT